MAGKEVKASLKSAREAISKKEYEEALQHCQTVLSHDNKNYNALVFTGVAADKLEKNEDALNAYKTAIEISPDQMLAWQGLCSFYEKNQAYVVAYKEALVKVYEKLIDLYKSDGIKREETMKRLAVTLSEIGHVDKSVGIYKDLWKLTEDKEKIINIKKSLIPLLELQTNVDTEMLFNCYYACFTSGELTGEEREKFLENYLGLILREKTRQDLKDALKKWMAIFSESVILQEYHIILLLEDSIDNDCDVSKINDSMMQLQKLVADNNSVLNIVQGYCLYKDQKYTEAKQYLLQGIKENMYIIIGYYILAANMLCLKENENCIKYITTGLQALRNNKKKLCTLDVKDVSERLELLHSKALYNLGTGAALNKAVDLLKKVNTLPEAPVILCKVYMKQGQYELAKELISSTQCDDSIKEFYISWYEYCTKQYQLALQRLEKLSTKPTGDVWCLKGKILWQLIESDNTEQQQKCYTTLLKAAQLDPNNGEPFLYLGHFYSKIRKDNRMSRKCYDKAYHLDKSLEEAGAAVCDLMTSEGDEDGAYNILLKVTREASAGSAKWAWLRLGLYQIKQDNPIKAISSFQSALRADTTDNHVWECLAEAYFNRGSYTAALKAFTKASELDPDSLYCLYQIATIRKLLGFYVEAITEYKLILEKSPKYVPALKGLGETCLLLGRNHNKENLDGRVQDNCQDALFYLTQAVSERPDMSCLWKLLGDSCLLLQPLSSENIRISVPIKLVEKGNSVDSVEVDKLKVLQIASKCYCKSIKILPDNSMLWHDLAISLFHQLKLVDEGDAKPLADKCREYLRKAVNLDSDNYQHWNALGVISASKHVNKLDLAQHCFIKSVHCESNNAVAWTNLGSLYLQHDNVQLAHEAYKVAQSLDPNYVACWIGQAMIAETVGHEDTMDLYRHTTELNYHPEGCVGYAHWVCSVLQDREKHNTDLYQYSIKQMSAIPSATDSLCRYLEREKNDTTALNMYGLLLEQQNLYKTAITVLDRCIQLLIKEDNQDGTKLDKARLNLARILCKDKNYKKSVKVFEQVTGVEQLEDTCHYGYSLYKLGQIEQSYKVYEKTVDMATTEEDKSHVYTALGMVAYKYGDIAGAKTALFKSSQMSLPSSYGLRALCGLGLLQKDITLVSAVLEELRKVDDGCHSDTIWLNVAQDIIQGNSKNALITLQKSLHTNPLDGGAWTLLAKLLVKFIPRNSQSSTNCLKISNYINTSKNSKMESEEYNNLLCTSQLQCGQHSTTIISNNALRTAQLNMFHYPGNVKHWLLFLSSVHAEGSVRRCLYNDSALRHVELRYLDYLLQYNDEIVNNTWYKLWCSKEKILCLIDIGSIEECKDYLKQIQEDYKESKFIQTINNLISKTRPDKTEPNKSDDNYNYLNQVIVTSFLQDGLIQESVDLLKHYLSLETTTSDKNKKLSILLKLSHIAFQLIMSKSDKLENIKTIFDDAITEILQLDSCNSVGLFMKAAVLLASSTDNMKRQLKVFYLSFNSNINIYLQKKRFAWKCLLRSYNSSQVDCCLSIGTTKARQQLIKLLLKTHSKKHDKLLETLLQEEKELEEEDQCKGKDNGE